MPLTLAFDIYGTLINTNGVRKEIGKIVRDDELTERWLSLWRQKQLEYSFRRAAMDLHTEFSTVTEEALMFCYSSFGRTPSQSEIKRLMNRYAALPAFSDAAKTISLLKDRGYRITAFSNGSKEAVTGLLKRSGLLPHFELVVSTEGASMFKPSPTVYRHFNDLSGSEPAETVLISGNSFDVIGALNAGWKSVWVRRDPSTQFDSWGGEPNGVVNGLDELPELLPKFIGG
ncbi:MAG: haloacid dehalogenase type II [Balneolaceae bacterium]|nr:haloacid dehalogenase type II [Balneolaceae bacterium]MCH8548383.1 haloacid dehalogenase type II [Balneolaceae bacterium]